jgi:hypothetical protein
LIFEEYTKREWTESVVLIGEDDDSVVP